MKSMPQDVLNQMIYRLDILKSRMVGLIEWDLTHDECIELIAPSEHITILKEAGKIADIHTSEQWLELEVPYVDGDAVRPKVMLYMRTHGGKTPPLRPQHVTWQSWKAGAPKVVHWLEKRLEIGKRFGIAEKVLRTLAEACDSGAQVRYLWPVVMHLTKGTTNEKTLRWGEKFSAYKAQRYAPVLTREFKEGLRDSSALLTSCALIGDDIPDRDWGEVQIDMWSLPAFKFDGAFVLRK